jgi:uncharacterized protein YdhG (YjbR/CyaY superfamily)
LPITTALTLFGPICSNSLATQSAPRRTIGLRQARQEACPSVTIFSCRQRDSLANVDHDEGREPMTTKKKPPKDIDEYVAGFPVHVREILQKIRKTIQQAAPDAEETIKYGMPTFTLEGNLVYFAAFKNHIGFFPPTQGDEEFKSETSPYEGPKGNLRFPLDAPIPYGLIGKVVKLRVEENLKPGRKKGKYR